MKKEIQLIEQLKNFGLNSSEWTLERIHSLGYVIRNKVDQNFLLYGKLEFKNKRAVWKSLELVSI